MRVERLASPHNAGVVIYAVQYEIVLPSTLAIGFEVTGAGSARALCRIDNSSQLRNVNPITSAERCGVNGVSR
jgi:hypothetical protein